MVTATLHWELPLRWPLALARATSTPSPPSSPAASTRPTPRPGSRPRPRRPLPAPRRAPWSRRPVPRAASHTPPAPRPRGAKRGEGRDAPERAERGRGRPSLGEGSSAGPRAAPPTSGGASAGGEAGAARGAAPRGVRPPPTAPSGGRHGQRPGNGATERYSPETQRSPREPGPERRRPDGGGSLSEEFMGEESRLWQFDGEEPRGVF